MEALFSPFLLAVLGFWEARARSPTTKTPRRGALIDRLIGKGVAKMMNATARLGVTSWSRARK
jgi:hypothetical protein